MTNNEKILDRLMYVLIFSFLFLATSLAMIEPMVNIFTPAGRVLSMMVIRR